MKNKIKSFFKTVDESNLRELVKIQQKEINDLYKELEDINNTLKLMTQHIIKLKEKTKKQSIAISTSKTFKELRSNIAK